MKMRRAIVAVALVAFSFSAQAAYLPVGGDAVFRAKTSTFLDRRYHNIMRQKYDFSCGSAALASLLTYHYGRPVDERVVIDQMYRSGDKEKIRREGFSLLDMKSYLETIGLRANGYRESLDKLEKVGIPAIVLINRKGYLHFVIVQGVTKNKVLIGDPALGRKVVDRKDFEAMWQNRILFVVDDDIRSARPTFNTVKAWDAKDPRDYSMPSPNTNLSTATLFSSYLPNVYNR